MTTNWPKTITEDWVEVLSLFVLLFGFLTAVLLKNVIWNYITVFLSGLLAARIYYIKKFSQPILPTVLIITGFLLGYLLGGFWASRFWILVFFTLAFALSYYLHIKKIIVIFKSENFLK